MSRISMVSLDEVVEISKQNFNKKQMGDIINIEKAFESGMEVVIREIAERKLLENDNICSPSDSLKKAKDQANDAFYSLFTQLSEEHRHKLFDLESAYNYVSALEIEEHFITGFVMGYRFLKEHRVSFNKDS